MTLYVGIFVFICFPKFREGACMCYCTVCVRPRCFLHSFYALRFLCRARFSPPKQHVWHKDTRFRFPTIAVFSYVVVGPFLYASLPGLSSKDEKYRSFPRNACVEAYVSLGVGQLWRLTPHAGCRLEQAKPCSLSFSLCLDHRSVEGYGTRSAYVSILRYGTLLLHFTGPCRLS